MFTDRNALPVLGKPPPKWTAMAAWRAKRLTVLHGSGGSAKTSKTSPRSDGLDLVRRPLASRLRTRLH